MQPGDLIDRYRVERLVGEGGMAAVYEVRHQVLGRTFALKVLEPRLARDATIRDRFLAEGRIQAQLRHDNIASVIDVVALPGVAGLVLEFVQGASLHEHLVTRGGPLAAGEIAEILLPVLDAVGFAHSQGVIHRDIKPENIVLRDRRDGRIDPVILDFGVAKIAADANVEHAPKQSTRLGSRMGTLHYMAPEQVQNAAGVDARCDIFAMGAILYELATGELAFAGDSDYATMQAIVHGRYARPGARFRHPNAALESCIAGALMVDRNRRIPDCATFASLLQAACVHGESSGHAAAPPPRYHAPAPGPRANARPVAGPPRSPGPSPGSPRPPQGGQARRSSSSAALLAVALVVLVAGLGSAVLCIPCALGAVGGLFRSSDDSWESYDWGEVDSGDWSWGRLTMSEASTPIYAQPDTSSSVLETRDQGDVLEYYGLDDALLFYKVKTVSGDTGYVEIGSVEVSF